MKYDYNTRTMSIDKNEVSCAICKFTDSDSWYYYSLTGKLYCGKCLSTDHINFSGIPVLAGEKYHFWFVQKFQEEKDGHDGHDFEEEEDGDDNDDYD